MTLTRLESFPFDSRYDGYDDNGYPVYDRAVGAYIMRNVFKRFFRDGVFSEDGYPFRITKASGGLAVTINPGTAIINGAMGTFDETTTLTLAEGTTAGVIKYAVFLRYDNNDEYRSIYLRTDASSAGGDIPEPINEANVTEYRIGYITVPSNSTDLSGATVVNEVGTSSCPYALPLFDINPEEVLDDLKADAQAAYDKYYNLLISSVDDTTAGYLQGQIDALALLVNDPQALRAAMGLGNTLGVLGVEYGGTGRNSEPMTGLVLSADLVMSYALPGDAPTFTAPISLSNVVVNDEDVASVSGSTLTIKGDGIYKIVSSGSVSGVGSAQLVSGSSGYINLSASMSKSGDLYGLPGSASASILSALNSVNISAQGSSSSYHPVVNGATVSISETVKGLKDPESPLVFTFPTTATITQSKDPGSFDISPESSGFTAKINISVKVYRLVAF